MNKPLRLLLAVVVFAVMLVAFILLVTGAVLGFIWTAHQLGVEHFMGMDTQSTDNYATVSGVFPVVVAICGFSTILGTAYRHLECHVDGCKHIGHQVHGTSFRACREHHPHHQGTVTAESIAHAAKQGHNAPVLHKARMEP